MKILTITFEIPLTKEQTAAVKVESGLARNVSLQVNHLDGCVYQIEAYAANQERIRGKRLGVNRQRKRKP